MSTFEAAVKARKVHWCEEYAGAHKIEPGETYVRLVAFPDGDINTGTIPWVMRLCRRHYEAGGIRDMPPPARRRPKPTTTPPTTRTDEESQR